MIQLRLRPLFGAGKVAAVITLFGTDLSNGALSNNFIFMNEQIIYNYQTGNPSAVVSSVLRSISAYTRVDRVASFKIGISCNPENRFRQAYSDIYDKMLVVYQSTSINNVRDLEYLLVEHNRELCDNIISGGGGNYGEPPYYMYVVVRE